MRCGFSIEIPELASNLARRNPQSSYREFADFRMDTQGPFGHDMLCLEGAQAVTGCFQMLACFTCGTFTAHEDTGDCAKRVIVQFP
jgi:hypothetical protein